MPGELITNGTNGESVSPLPPDAPLRIFLYSIIFVFAVVGNTLVIATLVQKRRMRTVTNVFLLNLAFSDILLGVFCMPVTLVGSLLRNFLFGWTMCKLIPYLQAVSVSVSVWTLVSISLERFFAICKPFESRSWQTISHSYKVIVIVWICSLIAMLPIACLSQLLPIRGSERHKCREVWPDILWERSFNIYLDVLLFLVPLLVMVFVYSSICITLYQGMRMDDSMGSITEEPFRYPQRQFNGVQFHNDTNNSSSGAKINQMVVCNHTVAPRTNSRSMVFRGNFQKARNSKRRIIRMLFVLVLEFFVCWTPLYTLHTMSLFVDPASFYRVVTPEVMAVAHLLSYVSSCCNPITYCFMHSKYRQAFKSMLGLGRKKKWYSNKGHLEKSLSMNSICSASGGAGGRSVESSSGVYATIVYSKTEVEIHE